MQHAEEGSDADRDVDQENPVPRHLVRQVAAQHRTQHRRDDGGDRGQRERLLPLLGREGLEDDRLLSRLQPAAEKALGGAEQQQLAEAGADAAGERSGGEPGNADQEILLAADSGG